MLLFAYPVLGLPFIFAYFARGRCESGIVFYAILAFTALGGAIADGLSLESPPKPPGSARNLSSPPSPPAKGPVST